MRVSIVMGGLLAASVALPQAWGQGGSRYEPSQRLRLLEGCMKDEVMNGGAHCVKRCQVDFRMEFSGKTPVCIAVKADATYVPPKPEYQAPKTPPKEWPKAR